MSLTVEQVLEDAKRLVERLRDHDNAADSLIEQSTTLNKRIEAMKQYQEEVEEMNSMARHRPRSALILGIQQENRQIRDLQRENRELRVALEEHQSALDLIMSSYREQVCRMLMANRFDKDCLEKHAEYHENSMASTSKIIEMAAVMKHAIELEEKTSFDVEQQLTRLQVENRGLRELLEISRTVHVHHSPISHDEKKDKEKDTTPVPFPNKEGANNLSEVSQSPPTKISPPSKKHPTPVPFPNKEGANNLSEVSQSPPTKISPPSKKHPTLKTISEAEKKTKSLPIQKKSDDIVSSEKTRYIDIKDKGIVKTAQNSDSEANNVDNKDPGGESGTQNEGAIDLEVENVLNDFADMTAGLDMDDNDESDD